MVRHGRLVPGHSPTPRPYVFPHTPHTLQPPHFHSLDGLLWRGFLVWHSPICLFYLLFPLPMEIYPVKYFDLLGTVSDTAYCCVWFIPKLFLTHGEWSLDLRVNDWVVHDVLELMLACFWVGPRLKGSLWPLLSHWWMLLGPGVSDSRALGILELVSAHW